MAILFLLTAFATFFLAFGGYRLIEVLSHSQRSSPRPTKSEREMRGLYADLLVERHQREYLDALERGHVH